MPDKLAKKKHPKHSMSPSFKDVELEERDDRVTYISINKKKDTEFIGSVPPNSRLAATLAQVAAAVQEDNLPEYRNGPASLISSISYRHQIQAAAEPSPSPVEQENHPRGEYAARYREGRADYPEPQRFDSSQEQANPQNQEVSACDPSLSPQSHSREGFSIGTRHELDRKVAYHTKSPNGELYVSAPTGSNEAQLFDEVARRMSKSNGSLKTSCSVKSTDQDEETH